MYPRHPGNASALRVPDAWNDAHPVGTRVVVRKVNGKTFEATTASRARPYGCSAVLELEDQIGCWLVSALEAATKASPSAEVSVHR